MENVEKVKATITRKKEIILTYYEWQCPFCGEECIDEAFEGLNYNMYCPECDKMFFVESE